MIKLGDTVKDKITGFEGIVDAVIEYRNGCRRMAIKSKELVDGKPVDTQWFDEPDLESVKKEPIKKVGKQPGGAIHLLPPEKRPI